MLELVVIVKALCEIAGLALLAQGLMYVLAGRKRENNFVYYIFRTVTSPVTKAVRFVTPRVVVDRHIGLVAFLAVIVLWYAAGQQKIRLCLTDYQSAPTCAEIVQAFADRVQPQPR